MKDKQKIAVVIVVLVVVGVIGYMIYSTQTNKPVAGSTTTAVNNGGLGSILGGLIGKLFPSTTKTNTSGGTGCQGSNCPGYGCANGSSVTGNDANGNPCSSFSKDCNNGCLESTPGYDCNGDASSFC